MGNATYGDILENEDRCFNRRSRDAGEHVCARCNEARDGEHALVFVVIDQARAVSVEQWGGVPRMTREMRMHLTRVVMIGVVVVEVHVHHRRGDRARLNGDGQEARDNLPYHVTILDKAGSGVKRPSLSNRRKSLIGLGRPSLPGWRNWQTHRT